MLSFFRKIVILAAVLFVFSLQGTIFAEEEGLLPKLDIEASGTLDMYSRYLWRGFTLDKDPVIQPGIALSSHGFTFSWWSSWDTDNNDPVNSDEIDYVIDYTKEFNKLSVSLGHTYYDFPGANTFSREFYLGFGFDTFLLSNLTAYFDYGSHRQGGGHGQYIVLESKHSFNLMREAGVSFDVGARVGYNHKLFIKGDGGDFLISAGFTVPLAESLTFIPTVNYAVPLADLSDSDDGNQNNQFYGGFSLAYAF